ncbi:MAG TPA: hypothetical protein DIT58_02880 [Porticoccaceae bacterium]|nr:hypothetical protein [Porticoccaceae bacterium]
MWTKKSLIAFSTIAAVCAPATGLAHSNPDLPQTNFLAGLLHPLTGLDHIAVLLLVGALLSVSVVTSTRTLQLRAGLMTLGGLLTWITLHYSGAYFLVYASGCLITSFGLISVGAAIAPMSLRAGKSIRFKSR